MTSQQPLSVWQAGALVILAAVSGWVLPGTTKAAATANNQEDGRMAQSVSMEALAQLKGKVYLDERSKLLQNPEQLQAAQAHLADDDWRLRIQAKIIQGWVANRALYEQVMTELDAVDYEREKKTAIGIARIWDMYALKTQQQHHELVLPLAWEVIRKLHEDWPTWKVVTFLHMIGAAPSEESIEPVMELMEATADPPLRSAAGQALSRLPRDAVLERLAVAEAEHQAVLRAIADTRDRFE